MPERMCEWCGKSLEGKRSNARYCDSTCRANATRWRQGRSSEAEKALPSAATPPIQAIREEQEAEAERWATVVDEAIRLYFLEHPGEPFHADDIEHLGVPDRYRKSVIGSQIAKWVNRKWMVECGRRKSVIPSRNGAKSNEYRLTEKGQMVIAGDAADERGDAREDGGGLDLSPPSLSVVPGDSRPDDPVSGAGVPKAQAEGGLPSSRVRTSTAPSEPAAEEGRLFDLSEAAERPLNPLTDREAA